MSDRPGRPLPPTDLPVADILDPLRAALVRDGTAVLVAPPGAGKTTVVPLALLDEPWLGDQKIVMLEPRRLATRAAAQRMAATTGTEVGDLVGYQTRDERRLSDDTRIEVLTEGILTRRLQGDPELPGVGIVIFDEVHERNLVTDIGLALAVETRSQIRPDLRLLAMSATPDTDGLVRLLDGPIIESEGRRHDVDVIWLGEARAARGRRRRHEPIEERVVPAVVTALADGPGDVLVFLPGIGEIRRTEQLLRNAIGPNVDVFALAGALTQREQDAALAPSAAGRRRVVLSTDIAETSLTVDGISVVVDAGLAREPRFDPRTALTRLTTVATSRSSAEQRAGRAGRTGPGRVYRLWNELEHATRARHRDPEIVNVDLAGLALEMAAWGGSDDLRFIDPPPPGALAQARDLLTRLYALDVDDGTITPVGRRMLGLPVHPRLARMIVVDASALACLIAAAVDERDVFRGPRDRTPTDLSLRIGVLSGRFGHDLADRSAVHRVRDRARDLMRRARIDGDVRDADPDRTGEVLLLAYPDRLAARRRGQQYQLRSGTSAFLPDRDSLTGAGFVVAADLDGRRDRGRLRLAADVDPEIVAATFGSEMTERRLLAWDPDRNDLVERTERRLDAIRLADRVGRPDPGPDTIDALLARVRSTELNVLGWSPTASSLRCRVEFLHRTVGDPWPDWSLRTLTRTVDEWLAPFLIDATGRADLEQLDLVTVLRSMLPWPDGARVDELTPVELDLPSGRTSTIDYSDDEPTADVRVQDLFGVTEHPMVAGRPIRLQLLSPADRPLQITTDLPGFWAGTWSEVRKEMAGRYPKHRWPADPSSATPTRLKRDPR